MAKNTPTKKKVTRKSSFSVRKIFIALLIVGAILYAVLFTWYLHTINQTINNQQPSYYSNLANQTIKDKLNLFSNSLGALGLKSSQVKTTKCTYELVYGSSKPQYVCTATALHYQLVNSPDATREVYLPAAQLLDSQLKRDGWVTYGNTASNFGDWFGGVLTGKDYSTDIGAYWNGKAVHCDLHSLVAYANPHSPAYNLELMCLSPVPSSLKNL